MSLTEWFLLISIVSQPAAPGGGRLGLEDATGRMLLEDGSFLLLE